MFKLSFSTYAKMIRPKTDGAKRERKVKTRTETRIENGDYWRTTYGLTKPHCSLDVDALTLTTLGWNPNKREFRETEAVTVFLTERLRKPVRESGQPLEIASMILSEPHKPDGFASEFHRMDVEFAPIWLERTCENVGPVEHADTPQMVALRAEHASVQEIINSQK